MRYLPRWLGGAGSALILSAGLVAAASPIEVEVVWSTPVEQGGKSCPRTADLNGDGIDDVVLGTGREDHWGEAIALDGRTGAELWRRRFGDEVLVALPLLDVDGDGTRDVFVGGRTRLFDVHALSGTTGQSLWSLARANPEMAFLPINFINLALVDDRDGDGLRDLLVVQSGGKDSRRFAARLHWVRSVDGRVLASTVAPDGKESYSIPVFAPRSGGGGWLYIGTGGETIGGSLIKLRLASLEEQWRVRALGGGFIGTPLVRDLDGDGRDEVVATAMNGAVYRIAADSGQVAWRFWERPYWTYVSPAPGAFNDEPTVDVVAAFNRGLWPRRDQGRLAWIDGATGALIAERVFEEPSRQTVASPLVLDVDHDGRDETLVVLSNPLPESTATGESHRLVLFDGRAPGSVMFALDLEGYSIATPRLADLDGDEVLDMVHAHQSGVTRFALRTSGRSPRVRWPEMGHSALSSSPSRRN